jgi:hypothetical protein
MTPPLYGPIVVRDDGVRSLFAQPCDTESVRDREGDHRAGRVTACLPFGYAVLPRSPTHQHRRKASVC